MKWRMPQKLKRRKIVLVSIAKIITYPIDMITCHIFRLRNRLLYKIYSRDTKLDNKARDVYVRNPRDTHMIEMTKIIEI